MVDFVWLEKYIADFCERYEYPNEATETFLEVYRKIVADKELQEEFFAPVQRYAESGKITEYKDCLCSEKKETLCGKVAKKLNISPYTSDFVFCLCLIPYLEKLYEKEGIDKAIFYQGMIDFRCKLWECKKVYNVWGSFVAGWFNGWFTLGRFAFSRLQFEPAFPLWFTGRLGKHFVPLWRHFVNMHIPSMGPLDHDEVVRAYQEAYEFFRKRLHYGKRILFVTCSWLLSPDHDKMFSEQSNIRKFIADFRRFNIYDEKDNGDFWRIYDRPYDKNNVDCSGDTTMQKGYAEILQKGGHIKHASGVFLYDGKDFYK